MKKNTLSIAMTGSGGAGVMTVGQMLVDAAAHAGWYGLMRKTLGPQIRGGESAALLRFGAKPVLSHGDSFDVILAFDWGNIERFAAEMPLRPDSVVLFDPDEGVVPEVIARSGAKCFPVSLGETAKSDKGIRANMIGLGVTAYALGLEPKDIEPELENLLGKKGDEAITLSMKGLELGQELAKALPAEIWPELPELPAKGKKRWSITGNDAAGMGAVRAGVQFCAAYPITPSTEILEWLAPNLARIGGQLVQCEDELASVNMLIGASYGGVPS
ncbi:MAG: 2-oxoacid:acceptor oxidoreductase family protein, partial [Cohaesibacter sp.]|nr:2-oxoacid:acceptor oxidoreductase family protein [Cohaesibacter sp.]